MTPSLDPQDDSWTDEHGTIWKRPTAWAYAKVCDALKHHKARADTLQEKLDRLGEQTKLTDEIKALKAEAARRQEQEFDDAEFT